MAPASTKYLRHKSSMPLVVSTTFAPEARIAWIFSFVMSTSRCWMASSSRGSFTRTWTPSLRRWRFSEKSRRAIFAPTTRDGIPCAARVAFSA